jgi:hypothetical protein
MDKDKPKKERRSQRGKLKKVGKTNDLSPTGAKTHRSFPSIAKNLQIKKCRPLLDEKMKISCEREKNFGVSKGTRRVCRMTFWKTSRK